VLTMDLHAGQVQGFFNVPVDHMTALPMFVDHLRERAYDGELSEPLVVVSPDAGRAKLANHFAERLGATLAVLTKQRPDHNEAEITLLIGDVAGRCAILIDDMIDTAGTLVAGAQVVKDAGATRVFAAATHALLSGRAVERLRESVIEEVVLTDTVPLPEEAVADEMFRVLSVDRILADSVHNVFVDESVSAIFAGENQLF
jgi:ribose-phosphate pyrophosphokinase